MESVEDKIKKLLALAQDQNDEESHTALLMAQKLMLKHNIHLDTFDRNNDNPNLKNEVVLEGKYPNWVYQLAEVISQNFRTKFYYVPGHHRSEFHFLGLEKDVDIAKGVFLYAFAAIKYFSNVFLKRPEIKRKYKKKFELKKDYIAGYLHGLARKLKEQVKSESLELALCLHPAVQEEIIALDLVAGIDRSRHVKDKVAYRMGYMDGQTFRNDLQAIEGYQ